MTESYLSRWAMVSTEPRSFTATNSMSAPEAFAARKKLRPMRPKPLMPTRTAMLFTLPCAARGSTLLVDHLPITCRCRGARPLAGSRAGAAAGDLLGDDDRAVLAPGAAEGEREVALALAHVGREQQRRAASRAGRGTRPSRSCRSTYALDRRVEPRQRAQLLDPVRVRQEAAVDHRGRRRAGRPCL